MQLTIQCFFGQPQYLILLGCIFTLSRHIKQLVSFISHGLKYSFEECAVHLNKNISFGLNLVKDISKSLQRHRQYIYPLLLNQLSTKVQLIIAHPFKIVWKLWLWLALPTPPEYTCRILHLGLTEPFPWSNLFFSAVTHPLLCNLHKLCPHPKKSALQHCPHP